MSRYYRTIGSEVTRLDGMVDDLFRLSRIHSGLLNLNLELVSLDDMVSDVLTLARPMAKAKGVHVVGQVAEGSAKARLSTTEFLRIMRNLLENVRRVRPPAVK